MAVAALIFGLLSFICLPFLGPILAVVFGIIGLGKAKQTGTGRGMSLAGIILGVIGMIAAIVVTVALVLAADDVSDTIDDNLGSADPADYELVAEACELDEFGFVTYTGTIENTSNETRGFAINAEFRDSDTDRVVDSGLADLVTDLPAGDTADWSITGSVDEGIDVTCTVSSVDYFF
jgi:hypothetical protein